VREEMSMYIIKILAAVIGWLLRKSLLTLVMVLIMAALVCTCMICVPLLLLASFRAFSSRFKKENDGKI
jgi:hypothetical protein